MLHFEGNKEFPNPPAEVWDKLRDARFLVSCIPDVESVSHSERESAIFVIRPGFSFVRGTLEVNLQVVPKVEGKELTFLVSSKGIGSTNRLEAVLTIAPGNGGTIVHWSVDVKELGGLLKAVPQGLIKASAQKVIGDVWTSLERNLAGRA
jgi:carbon monoxide dehydrogenase subunit G